MLIDRIIYPIKTLGPGERLVIWTVGCSKHCKNCANPELWFFDKTKDISIDDLCELITQSTQGKKFDGVTITGGDPFEQLQELLNLLRNLKRLTDDIIVYTGYIYDEIKKNCSNEELNEIKETVTLLIDGQYIDELNDNQCVLRGSTNQNLIFFNGKHKETYDLYLSEERKIQNVFYDNKLISVGIHNREKLEE